MRSHVKQIHNPCPPPGSAALGGKFADLAQGRDARHQPSRQAWPVWACAQANLDKTKTKLEELAAKLEREQAKLGTYNADLKAYKDKYAVPRAPQGAKSCRHRHEFSMPVSCGSGCHDRSVHRTKSAQLMGGDEKLPSALMNQVQCSEGPKIIIWSESWPAARLIELTMRPDS